MAKSDEFDLLKASEIAQNFTVATGICCVVITADGREDFECPFCGVLRTAAGEEPNCRKVHLHGINEARRFGGQYIFMCPYGLCHIVSPIVDMGQTKAAFLVGPLLIIDKDDYLSEEIDKRFSLEPEKMQVLRDAVDNISYIARSRIPHLAQLICALADYVSDGGEFEKSQQMLQQQADISTEIHRLKEDEMQVSYPFEKEDELLSAISEGDEKNARRLLNEVLGVILLKSGNKLDAIRERVLDLVILLSRSAVKSGADPDSIFAMIHEYSKTIYTFTNIDELVYWLANIIQNLTTQALNLEDKFHSDALYNAIEYMRRRYKEKITLEEVSAYVHFTPTYFSKIFKKEMDKNFSDFLNEVRVEQAKKLLRNSNMQIVDIAAYTGFTDQSYFNKVFKKHTGVTPKKYRESRGIIKRRD